MNMHTKLITIEQMREAAEKDEQRVELHDALHYLGKMENGDEINVSIPIDVQPSDWSPPDDETDENEGSEDEQGEE